MLAIMLGALLAADPSAAAQSGSHDKPMLAVLDLVPSGGIEPSLAGAVTDAITSEVASRGIYAVMSSKEIATIIGQERQRDLLGCSDQSTSCATEIAGAAGARFALSGSLAKLGETYQLSLQTVDSVKGQVIGRSTRLAKDLDELRSSLPFVVAEATGTPLPPPPSKVLPYSMLVAGGLVFVAGGLAGLDAISRDRAMAIELENGMARPGLLRTQEEYRRETQFVGLERTVSLAALGLGAALVAGGAWLSVDRTPAAELKIEAAFVPTGSGFAITGVW